jgi:hypothetical protein
MMIVLWDSMATVESGRSIDRLDILHAIREEGQMIHLRIKSLWQGCFRKPKKNSELTQNWCCQPFHI